MSRLHGRWVRALVEAGLLTTEDVERLSAEIQGDRDDRTPDLAGKARPWPAPPAGTPPPPPSSPFPPELRFLADWPRYRVERHLGSGGMGTVYKAFDPTLGRWVALKFLHRNDALQTERFLREARAQARVSHPNVCQIHEVGEAEGRPYISMQYIDGRSLGELCDELSLADKVQLVRDTARAVHAAHRTGLVHRDLKPGNILLARDEGGRSTPTSSTSASPWPWTRSPSPAPAWSAAPRATSRPRRRRGRRSTGGPTSTASASCSTNCWRASRRSPAPTSPASWSSSSRRSRNRCGRWRRPPPRTWRPSSPSAWRRTPPGATNRPASSPRTSTASSTASRSAPVRRAGPTGRASGCGRTGRWPLVSVAAVLALVLVGTLSLRAQWQARERAQLAQKFGQRIGSFKTSMEYVAGQPLHDITPYKRELRAEMDSIRAEMRKIGPLAAGPGNFALGQGYLVLHQDDEAREHLERAWKAGERGTDRSPRRWASPTAGPTSGPCPTPTAPPSPRGRPAARRPSAPTAGPPSNTCARRSRARPAALAGADRPLRGALRRRPGGPPAGPRLRRRRRIWRRRSTGAQATRGGPGGALRGGGPPFDRAGEVYGRAGRDPPQRPRPLRGGLRPPRATGCRRPWRWPTCRRPEVRTDLAACDRALQVDPGLAEGLVLRGRPPLAPGRAEIQARDRSHCPSWRPASGSRSAPSRSIPATSRRTTISPSPTACWRSGRWATACDPRADIRQGIEAARRAVEIQPEMPSSHANLGTAYLVLAQDQQRRGADPRQATCRAVASYQEAERAQSEVAAGLHRPGQLLEHRSPRSRSPKASDPSASIGKAAAALEHAAALNPRSAQIYNNLGNTHLTLGEYLLARGEDPRGALDRAAISYRRADRAEARLLPGALQPRLHLAQLGRGAPRPGAGPAAGPRPGRRRAGRGAAPQPHGRRRLPGTGAGEAARRPLADAAAAGRRARSARRRRRARPRRGAQSPAAGRLLYPGAGGPRPRRGGARTAGPWRRSARGSSASARRSPSTPARRATSPCAASSSRWRARLETDPRRREQAARKAVATLEAALKANPLLQREYGPALAEARLDAGLATPRPAQL